MAAGVRGDDPARVCAQIVEGPGVLPAVGQDRRAVPVGAEAVQQILAHRLEPAVLPVAVRIAGRVVAQVIEPAEVYADRLQQ